jgi:hypothetical protein
MAFTHSATHSAAHAALHVSLGKAGKTAERQQGCGTAGEKKL